MFSGCISTANFQEWSGPPEFEGKGGAFVTKDGIDIYSVGTPNKKCKILGVIHTQTLSRASLMMVFRDSWSTSALVKEAKARGGNAVILADNNTQMWLSSGNDANGNSQIATDASSDRVAILVKYVGDVQEENVSAEIEAKLLGHWTFIPPPEMPLHGQWDIYFFPESRYKEQNDLIKQDGQPLEPTPLEVGRYYFAENKLVQWSDRDEKPYPPIDFTVNDTQLTFELDQRQFTFQKQAQ